MCGSGNPSGSQQQQGDQNGNENQPQQVRDLVHGAMFTRGPDKLNNTAIFVGGTDVRTGEKLLQEVTDCFFGPLRVSVMLDANGANTTAAAAVLAASKHVDVRGAKALATSWPRARSLRETPWPRPCAPTPRPSRNAMASPPFRR